MYTLTFFYFFKIINYIKNNASMYLHAFLLKKISDLRNLIFSEKFAMHEVK